ncbi:MAG: UTP--glucose-1-phosphate uridylyltransferase, partial [Planctomycetota bacterium]
VGAKRIGSRDSLFEVTQVVEKPTPTYAEQHLMVAGLRASHYLCLSGAHVLTPTVMELLAQACHESSENVQLSPSLGQLAKQERYLATEINGCRFNIGMKYGLLKAQLALALAGKDRDEILQELIQLVATVPGVSPNAFSEVNV